MSISINKKYSFEISINSPTILVRNHSQLDQLDYESSGHTGFVSSDEFSSHIENTNNPHSVTKTQVGLEDVEDGAQINIIEKVNIDGADLIPDVDKRITLPNKEPAFAKNTAFNKNFGSEENTVTQGNDARLSDARTPLPHNHDDRYYTESEIDTALDLKVDKVEGETLTPNKYTNDEKSKLSSLDTQAELDIKFGAKEDIANKGVANGYAPLNASGIVDPIYVPGAYTDYVEYATYADLPASGVEGTLYVVIADETSGDNTSTYRWTGSVYVNVTDKLSASEVKALYESNANTNAYTDDEKTKLSGIEALAEVNIIEGVKVDDVLLMPDVDRIVNVDISGKENTANKVNAFQATPDDTHYPSEKLVKDTFDEVGSTLASTVLKNAEQELRIATIEEAYRKSQSGELTATKSGTDIISLGKDVAPAPLQVKVEGGLIPALENLVTNGDFSGGTTGWATTGASISVTSNVLTMLASAQGGSVRYVYSTTNANVYYARGLIKSTSNQVALQFRNGSNFITLKSHTGSNVYEVLNGGFLTTSANATDYLYIGDSRVSGWNNIEIKNIHLFNLTKLFGVTATSGAAYDNAVADIETMLALKGGYISTTPIHAVGMNKRVRSVGKNLFDKSLATAVYIASNGTAVSSTTVSSSDFIKIKPSTQYVVSNERYGAFYDINKDFISYESTLQTFTTPSNAHYIRYSFLNELLDTFQLEQGTVATTYVPYVSSDLYLQANAKGYRLPNEVKDLVKYINGKYYFIKNVTINIDNMSTLAWGDGTDLGDVYRFTVNKIFDNMMFSGPYAANVYFFINGIKYTNSADYNSNTRHFYINSTQILIFAEQVIVDAYEGGTPIVRFKDYLSKSDVLLCYQLATPIETEILALGNAQGLAGGTVYIDDIMADSNIYTSKYDIENTAYPIKSLDRIVKINADGSQTELAVSSATIAGDGLSFTHPSLVANDIVWVAYVPNVANTFKSNTFVTYYDNPFIAVQPNGTPRRITFSVDNSGVVTVSSEAV